VRAFSFIFIIYIVFLVTQPCQDMISPIDNAGSGETVIANIQNDSDDHEVEEECSPFCACSCCIHAVARQRISTESSLRLEFIGHNASSVDYDACYSKAHQNSIWQPPKA
jgi:hypothetical protein